MQRRLAACTALIAVGALGLGPAHAGTKPKPKPKPITGSYSVTLPPDPTPDTPVQVGCNEKNPKGFDKHEFVIPAKGTLHVVLDSPNPEPVAIPDAFDWDLYILSADGEEDSSHSPEAHEETTTKFAKKRTVWIEVCNLSGEPTATVNYTFTYA